MPAPSALSAQRVADGRRDRTPINSQGTGIPISKNLCYTELRIGNSSTPQASEKVTRFGLVLTYEAAKKHRRSTRP